MNAAVTFTTSAFKTILCQKVATEYRFLSLKEIWLLSWARWDTSSSLLLHCLRQVMKKKNNKITEPPNHSDRPFLKRDSLWVAVPLSPTLKMFSSCNGLILKQRQWKITYVIYRTNNACWTVPRAESPRPPLYTRSLRQFRRSAYETRWNHS